MTGCAIPGLIAYKLFGPPANPARYAPASQPTLVLVENRQAGSSAMPEADELSGVITDELTEHKVVPVIDPAKVHALRDQDPYAFAKMTIAQIGRAVGARQVIYVQVNALSVDNAVASDIVRVSVAASIKVVNAIGAETVWPESGESEAFTHTSRRKRVESGDTGSLLKHQVLRESGVEIARWFYAWQPETMGEETRDVNLR